MEYKVMFGTIVQHVDGQRKKSLPGEFIELPVDRAIPLLQSGQLEKIVIPKGKKIVNIVDDVPIPVVEPIVEDALALGSDEDNEDETDKEPVIDPKQLGVAPPEIKAKRPRGFNSGRR